MAETNSLTKTTFRRPRWYIPLAVILSVFFLVLAFRGVQWKGFISAITNCQVLFLLPAVLICVVNYIIRSLRWGTLLRAAKPVPVDTLFWSTGVGYLGNNFLPFRAGDVLRSIVLGDKTGISKVYAFATVVVERVVDAVFLIILGLLLIPSIPGIPGWLQSPIRTLGVLSFIALAALLLAPRFEDFIEHSITRLPLNNKSQARLSNLIKHFIKGAASFQAPGRALKFLLLTCLIWFLDGLGMMFTGRAFFLEISLTQSLILLVSLGLSSAIPSTPGYIGVYQFVAVTVMGFFGYPKVQVLPFILVAQAINMLLTLVWGIAGLWVFGIKRDDLSHGRFIPPLGTVDSLDDQS